MALLKAITLSLFAVAAFADGHAATGTSVGACYSMKSHVVSCFSANTTSCDYWYSPSTTSTRDPTKGCCHCKTSCPTTVNDAAKVTSCEAAGAYHDVFGHYTAVSAVSIHAAIVKDITAFEKQIGAKNYTGAKEVYTKGMYSYKSSSMRTLQGFAKKHMTGTGSDEDVKEWQHQKAAFGATSDDWHDEFMLSILDKTGMFKTANDAQLDQAADKTMQCIAVNYVLYEFTKAIRLVGSSYKDSEDAKGGVHNWDEGRAFFYGPNSLKGKDSPWQIAGKRDNDYGTGNSAIIDAAMIAGQKASRNATASVPTMKAEYAKIVKALMTAFVQAGLKYAFNSESATTKDELMEGYAYFRCGAGMLYGSGAKGKAATTAVLKLYEDAIKADKTAVDFCDVKTHLMDAGLTAKEIGDCSGVAAADKGTKCKIAGKDTYIAALAKKCDHAGHDHSSTPAPTKTSGAASLAVTAGLALATARALF